MQLSDSVPRPVRLREDKRPSPPVLAGIVLGLVFGTFACLLALSMLLSVFGSHLSGWVTGPKTAGFEFQYKRPGGSTVLSGWAFNWNGEAFDSYGRKTGCGLYLSSFPLATVLVAADTSPGVQFYVSVLILAAAGVGGLFPTFGWARKAFAQISLIRMGREAPGFVVRHQPFDRRQGRTLQVWFEFTPDGSEDAIESHMAIDRKAYRTLKNRAPVTVLHGADLKHAIIYDVCDFEAVTIQYFESDEEAADPRKMRDQALPAELEYLHGRGPEWARNLGMVRAALLIAMATSFLWGHSGYGMAEDPALTVELPGGLRIAPWFGIALGALVGAYIVCVHFLKEFRLQEPPPTMRKVYTSADTSSQEWDETDIDDPISTSLKKSTGRGSIDF